MLDMMDEVDKALEFEEEVYTDLCKSAVGWMKNYYGCALIGKTDGTDGFSNGPV